MCAIMGPDQCRIQQFWQGAGFSTSVQGEKPLCSWEVWGAVSLPQWGPGAKPRESLAILHSE